MPNNQRSKRKSKNIEPITFDELRDAAGMSGFVSFLNLPTDEVVSAPVDKGPVEGTVAAFAVARVEETVVVESGAVSTPVGNETVPLEAPLSQLAATPAVITPIFLPRPGNGHIIYSPVRGGKNLYRCTTAQEGHSHLEEALYQLLWSRATVISTDERIAQVSQSDLARQLRITDKNMRIALERLVEKRSIEIGAGPDFALKAAKQYRVYSYAAILRRRREAGLEWVIRNKGIQFVSREDVERYKQAESTPVDTQATTSDGE